MKNTRHFLELPEVEKPSPSPMWWSKFKNPLWYSLIIKHLQPSFLQSLKTCFPKARWSILFPITIITNPKLLFLAAVLISRKIFLSMKKLRKCVSAPHLLYFQAEEDRKSVV